MKMLQIFGDFESGDRQNTVENVCKKGKGKHWNFLSDGFYYKNISACIYSF